MLLKTLAASAIVFSIGLECHGNQTQKSAQPSGSEQNRKIRLWSFQRGLWRAPTEDCFLRYNFSAGLLNELTVCYWVRFERFSRLTTHLSYSNTNDNNDVFAVYHNEKKLMVWLSSQFVSDDFPEDSFEIVLETWNHMCHVLGKTTYTFYWQGKNLYESPLSNGWSIALNGSLVLGQEQDTLGGGFDVDQVLIGDLTQVVFWNASLTSYDVQKVSGCNSINQREFFNSNNARFENTGVQQAWIDITELCGASASHTLILSEDGSADNSSKLCKLMNGTTDSPLITSERNFLSQQQHQLQKNCEKKSYKTLKIMSGDVRCSKNERTLSSDPGEGIFSPEYSIGCGVPSNKEDNVANLCGRDLRYCISCQLQRNTFLYLRGLCFNTEYQSRFRVAGCFNGRPLFVGFYNLIIWWENVTKTWLLYDTSDQTAYLEMIGDSDKHYPLGRNKWITAKEMCGIPQGDITELSLSPCLGNNNMCHSGHCIQRKHRCNIRKNCDDGSDEINCERILLPDDYEKDLPPFGPRLKFLRIAPSIELSHVTHIDDLSTTVTLDFQVNLTWRDPRLSFKHLETHWRGSIFKSDEISELWIPSYQIMNLDRGNVKILDEKLTIQTAENDVGGWKNEVDMDLIYPATTNSLRIIHNYSARIVCESSLFTYPFDTQRCQIEVHLSASNDDYVKFSEERGSFCTYSGKPELNLYTIDGVAGKLNANGSRVTLEFRLLRRPGISMLNIFLPSALLLLVSWATLFIQLEELKARAPMSLTTLLVLYTLFANVSQSLPATAGVKLIDVWFFFNISVLFANVMIHLFVCRNSREEVYSVGESDSQGKLPRKMSRLSCLNFCIPSKYLRIYRDILLPCIVAIFSIAFWVTVFTMH